MLRYTSPLKDLKIASPCSADWEQMYGNERRRFCGDCKLNVYNLSDMSAAEAESFLTNSEGRLCVRFYRRADGTVLTKDCPVGWERVKQRTKLVVSAMCALIASFLSGVLFVQAFRNGGVLLPATETGEISSPPSQPLMGNFSVEPKREIAETGAVANIGQKMPVTTPRKSK